VFVCCFGLYQLVTALLVNLQPNTRVKLCVLFRCAKACVPKAVNTIAIRLRYDYDTTTTYRTRLLPFGAIRREQKMNMSVFRRSRVVVVS